jgi:hypothetical protein
LVRTSGDDRAAAAPRLRQIGEGSGPHAKALDWFKTLPVWLEVPSIHAFGRRYWAVDRDAGCMVSTNGIYQD